MTPEERAELPARVVRLYKELNVKSCRGFSGLKINFETNSLELRSDIYGVREACALGVLLAGTKLEKPFTQALDAARYAAKELGIAYSEFASGFDSTDPLSQHDQVLAQIRATAGSRYTDVALGAACRAAVDAAFGDDLRS